MILELAARTGRPMTVIARRYSLPELIAVTDYGCRMRAADLLAETHSRSLAKDVSSKDPVKNYREFVETLSALAVRDTPKPKRANKADLSRGFGSLGLPQGAPVVLDQPWPAADAQPKFPGAN